MDRIINLDSILNIRDLGGLETTSNLHVKPKKILRSGNLSAASDSDIKYLMDNYKLETIIDLRNEMECLEAPDNTLNGMVKHLNFPILSSKQMGVSHEEETDRADSLYYFVNYNVKNNCGKQFMTDLYLQFINSEHSREYYRKVFKTLLQEQEGSYLIHCTVGKDRAGTSILFLLKVLGVKDEDILEDYLLTNIYVEEDIQNKVKLLSSRIDSPILESTYRALFGADRAYIEALAKEIIKKYQTFDRFALEFLDLSKQDQDLLRSIYLE